MSMSYIGGYLFISPDRGLSPAEIISRTLDTLTVSATFSLVSVVRNGQHQKLSSPPETALAELTRVGEGQVLFALPAPVTDGVIAPGSVRFEPHPSGYYLVCISFDPPPLRGGEGSERKRATVEMVFERWVRCCERVGAEYAEFGWLDNQTDPKFADQIVQKDLIPGKLEQLLSDYGVSWLAYAGPRLAPFAQKLQLEAGETRQELASGGVVIRTSEFPLSR